MTASMPGVHIINSSHIVSGTLNVNETIQLAQRVTKMLLGESFRYDAGELYVRN